MKWFPYNKGGTYRRWYGNREFVVNWENDGFEIRDFKDEKGKVRSRPQNTEYYFKPAITWSDVTSSSFSGRFSEGGFIFDVKGSSGFPTEKTIFYILAFLNSHISQNYIKMINPTNTTQVGDMARIPVIMNEENKPRIDQLVEENISLSKIDWDSFEISWNFEAHPLLIGNSIKSAFGTWETDCRTRFDTLKSNEEELNRLFIDIYGLGEELTPEVDDKDVTVRLADLERDIKSLISYAVGCLFGRYSLDSKGLAYAGGDWDDSKYQKLKPVKDNCIVITEEGVLENDITTLFIHFLNVVYGEDTLEENMVFISQALGGKGAPREVIQNYFLKQFFKDHVQIYQKKPIYWLYDSGKNSGFKALIYMHRYHEDTFSDVREYLHKIQSVNEELQKVAEFDVEQGNNKSQAQKKLTKLQKQMLENQDFDVKIGLIASLRIPIDLDDGVTVNYLKVQTGQDGKKYEILGKLK